VFIRNVLNPDISTIDINTIRCTAVYQWKPTVWNYFSQYFLENPLHSIIVFVVNWKLKGQREQKSGGGAS
jgi:hypothetical protein